MSGVVLFLQKQEIDDLDKLIQDAMTRPGLEMEFQSVCVLANTLRNVLEKVAETGEAVHVEQLGNNGITTGYVAHDAVNHPKHYNTHPSGVECIAIIEHMPYNVGAAFKYMWRAGQKGDILEDMRKAAWHVNREIERLEKLRRG